MFGDDTNAGRELKEKFASFFDLSEKFYNRNLLKKEDDIKQNAEVLKNWSLLIEKYKEHPENYYKDYALFSPYAEQVLKHKYRFEEENFGRLLDMNKKIEVDITFDDIREEISDLTGPASGQEIKRPWFKSERRRKSSRTGNSNITV